MKEIWLRIDDDQWDDVKEGVKNALELGYSGVFVKEGFEDKIRQLGRIKVITDRNSFLTVSSSEDQDRAIELSKTMDYLFLDFSDWKVIPLENLIAMKGRAKLIVHVDSVESAKLALETLEKGADGIIVSSKDRDELSKFREIMSSMDRVEMVEIEIDEIKPLGMGDRVCIDTISLMNVGEGMLVGNSSKFMFLVASESEESEYVSSRPFRVNAGSVNAYIRVGDRTRYLSELKAGDEVEIVSYDGKTRRSYVGRVKIEKRPMILISGRISEEKGTIILQNAETIKLVNSKGEHISVSMLKEGDKVLGWVDRSGKGRHFGAEVDEFIVER
ncbi:3-dehydroquinate synthase II [Archaeoglobus sulfaticallidus PM70-1]|uniref:3-dehydroquinate synthase n=1 Tax=Archaeoglobus sulfaticallidus PM70-1 TaxID=387631 RepID=N0BKF7_9EURY|nr:3-dehydroquinate synthase II [Archaeoglobus sulfaticallidus]AGK60981.1 3-dehydroquinate synthase II [Archaeoglobus sulfaticallidus PM70-1]